MSEFLKTPFAVAVGTFAGFVLMLAFNALVLAIGYEVLAPALPVRLPRVPSFTEWFAFVVVAGRLRAVCFPKAQEPKP